MKRLFLILVAGLALTPRFGYGQGEWSIFTNANYVYDLAADGDYIWAASRSCGITRWNRNTGEYEKWTSQDNLPNGMTVVGTDMVSVAIGPDGRKWFGAWQLGVTVYDDEDWTSYTTKAGLVNRRVNVVELSPEGVAWIGTQGGVSRFDGTTWTSYSSKDSGMAGNIVVAIAFDSTGNTWIGTTTGLTKIDSIGNLVSIDLLRNIRVNAIVTDPEGRVWVATNGSSIFRYDGIDWVHKLPYPDDPDGFDGYMNTLALSPTGDIWAGGWAIAVIDRNTITRKTQYNPREQNGPVDDYQQKIVFDEDGNAWVCHGHRNVPIEKFDGTTWTSYKTEDELNNNVIFGLAVDDDGTLWIGENGAAGGVQTYDGTNWASYTTADGLPTNVVNDISIAPDGNVWVATTSGAARYDGNTWTAYTTDDGLVNNWVEKITFDTTGTVWFATRGGIGIGIGYEGGMGWSAITTEYDTTLHSDNVRTIAVDPRGAVWAGTSAGLYKGESTGADWESRTYTTVDGLVHNSVTAIIFDADGIAWIGTEGGISRFDGTTWTSYTWRNSGLLSGNIFDMRFDANGILWAGDGLGLNAFNGKDWFPFTAALQDQCLSLAIDKEGNKWVGTWAGLKKFVSPPVSAAGLEVSQTVDTDTASVEVSFGETTVSLGFDSGSVAGKTVTVYGFGSEPPSEVFSGTLFTSAVGYYSIDAPEITDFIATLSFGYTDSALALAGIAETDLEIAYFDDASGIWRALATTVDTVGNTASATVDHFSLWALADKTDNIISGVKPVENNAVVNTYKLAQNYPNPFNPTTTIEYQLKEAGNLTLEIYNLLGQKVKVLMRGNQPSGTYSITWDGRNDSGILVPSGVYFYRLKAGNFVQTRKMLFVK